MKHRLIVILAILTGIALWIAFAFFPGKVHHIDLTSTDGLNGTCAELAAATPSQLRRNEDRIAYAVCTSIAYMKYVAALPHKYQAMNRRPDEIDKALHGELEYALEQIGIVRATLEEVALGDRTMPVHPGNWHVDFNQDGKLSALENYFFWVPKREGRIPPYPFRPEDWARYYQTYYVDTRIRLDQSDIYWAIAYCHFAEQLLNTLYAYRLNFDKGNLAIRLTDRERIAENAYQHALAAVEYSKRLRTALLKETDDNLEWIANDRQNNTVFPVTMDAPLFDTWGKLLDYLHELLKGKTLLGGTVTDANGHVVVRLAGDLCAESEGVNLRELFRDPPPNPLDRPQLRRYCRKPSATLPLSGLHRLLSEVYARSARDPARQLTTELHLLRYLYWVN